MLAWTEYSLFASLLIPTTLHLNIFLSVKLSPSYLIKEALTARWVLFLFTWSPISALIDSLAPDLFSFRVQLECRSVCAVVGAQEWDVWSSWSRSSL